MRILTIIGTWFYLVFWWHMQTHGRQWTVISAANEKCTVFSTPISLNARLEEGRAALELSTRGQRLNNNHQEDSRTQHKGEPEFFGETASSGDAARRYWSLSAFITTQFTDFLLLFFDKFIIYCQLRI